MYKNKCPHNKVQQFSECCLDCGRNIYESDEEYDKYMRERVEDEHPVLRKLTRGCDAQAVRRELVGHAIDNQDVNGMSVLEQICREVSLELHMRGYITDCDHDRTDVWRVIYETIGGDMVR
jgi:DNA-directed RNA polymerase subunit N (RpoN/RPB10)